MTAFASIALAFFSLHVTLGKAVRPELDLRLLQPDPTKPADEQPKAARGGPYVQTCEQLMEVLKTKEEACTLDEFNDEAWTAAWEVDCQLQKTQNGLELLTSRFQQKAAASWKKDDSGYSNNTFYSKLHKCPSDCGQNCVGQQYLDHADGQRMLILPQPKAWGSAYAYSGDTVRILTEMEDVTSINEEEVEKGLGYAFLVGHLENFSQTQKYYFTPGVHSRLRYRGNDPAILMDLDNEDVRSAAFMCAGAPNKNVLDDVSYEQFFSKTSPCHGQCALESDEIRAYWTLGSAAQTVVASKATLDHLGKPMGTVAVDVNVGVLGNKFLDSLGFSPSVYALIVEKSGRIIYVTPQARISLFGNETKEDAIYNVDGLVRCTTKNPNNCTWKPRKSIKITALRDRSLFSGADFSDVLENMWGPNGSNCSTDVQSQMIEYPKAGCDSQFGNTSAKYLVSFCTFVSVPAWGLIIGTNFEDVNDAATMQVDPLSMNVSMNMTQEHISKEVVVTNTGRVTLPFQVDRPLTQFVHVVPDQGLLQPNESAIIYLTLQSLPKLQPGLLYQGLLTVRGNLQKPRGTCFRRPAHVLVRLNVPKLSKSPLQQFVKDYGEWILLAAIVLVAVCLVRVAYIQIRKYFRREARQSKIIEEALQSTTLLPFPMVLMKAIEFKIMARLASHEEVHHQTTWLYSVEEVQEFCSRHHVVFISHQWTAFDCPDPTNIQYKAMLMSIETLQMQEEWDETDIYLWIDYSSIPQKHPPTQALAINSLTVYASNVSAFVVVAPVVQHQQLGEVCDKASYQRRAWCRAEQLAHLLAVGSKNMYLAEDGELTRLSDIDKWLTQSIYVFQGNLTCCRRKHEGMDKCDKELLVTPMLGLWAQLNKRCRSASNKQPTWQSAVSGLRTEKLMSIDHVHEEISKKLEEVFPREFDFQGPSGHLERRQLFGDLLTRLPQPGDEDQEKMCVDF